MGGRRVRGLYLLLTNEPSNHKEWAGGETKKGPERAEGRGEEKEGYGSGKVVDHEKGKRRKE